MTDHIMLKPITASDIAAMDAQDMRREIVSGQWDEERKMTGKGQLLSAGEVIPGFEVAVADVFAV